MSPRGRSRLVGVARFISAETADRDYGVVIAADHRVDAGATESARAARRSGALSVVGSGATSPGAIGSCPSSVPADAE